MRSLSIRICVAVIGLALVAWAHPKSGEVGDADEGVFALRPETARVAALGFDALVADYHWLQAVQLVGRDQRVQPRQTASIARLIETVTLLDPWVDHPYRFATLFLTDSAERVEQGNRLMERGIAYHPRDWRNRFYLSFNHFFYLGDEALAAEVLEPAVDLPGAPQYLGRLLARLRSHSGGLEAAAAYLEELLRDAPDEWARAEYEKALDEIETERRARFLDQARDVFRERNGRDIAELDELVRGPERVLRSLPPEPHGWEWALDEKGRIVSSYYGRRYQLNLHERDRERRQRFQEQLATQQEKSDG